jgi:hypothetical protein
MKILVCGGRSYGHVVRTAALIEHEPPETQQRIKEHQFIQDTLNRIVNKVSAMNIPGDNWLPTDITIIHGCATGADSAASDFASTNFCLELGFPADWAKYGKKAGYIRNKQMLDEGQPDLVVAFEGGKGTTMMIDLARKAGVKVIDMGSKGSQSMVTETPKFKTNAYTKIYMDRISELKGASTSYLKQDIMHELIQEEKNWLANMGAEYDDIIQAQELMDRVEEKPEGAA